jgi:hypothetical protein
MGSQAMPAKTVSEHIKEVMRRIDKVQPIKIEEARIRANWSLYHLFKAIQVGNDIIPPLYPKTNLAMPIVEEYRKTLKPSDILDDPPGPLTFGF